MSTPSTPVATEKASAGEDAQYSVDEVLEQIFDSPAAGLVSPADAKAAMASMSPAQRLAAFAGMQKGDPIAAVSMSAVTRMLAATPDKSTATAPPATESPSKSPSVPRGEIPCTMISDFSFTERYCVGQVQSTLQV